jgi:hypothetical protein
VANNLAPREVAALIEDLETSDSQENTNQNNEQQYQEDKQGNPIVIVEASNPQQAIQSAITQTQ